MASCTQTLLDLAACVPAIVLPTPQNIRIDNAPCVLPEAIQSPTDVPAHPADIRQLKVICVEGRAEKDIGNTLIAQEHLQRLTPFAERQVRYLPESANGWLGPAGRDARQVYGMGD